MTPMHARGARRCMCAGVTGDIHKGPGGEELKVTVADDVEKVEP